MATAAVFNFRPGKHYQATILRAEPHVQPGWGRVRNRLKLVLKIHTHEGVRSAHIFIDFDDHWLPVAEDRVFYRNLFSSIPSHPNPGHSNEMLPGTRFTAVFGPKSADGQRQALVNLFDAVPAVRSRARFDPSLYSIAIDLKRGEIRATELSTKRLIWQARIEGVSRTVMKALLIFGQSESGSICRKDYAQIAKRASDKPETVRKVMSMLRRWLDEQNHTRLWGKALLGKPGVGYCLEIPVRIVDSKHRTDIRSLPPDVGDPGTQGAQKDTAIKRRF